MRAGIGRGLVELDAGDVATGAGRELHAQLDGLRCRPCRPLPAVVLADHKVATARVAAIVVNDEKTFAARALPARSVTPPVPPTIVIM